MSNLRQKFTENAEQFDSLMVEMLAENERFKKDAARYQYLRNADINAVYSGGLFAGKTPDNLVLNGEDLDNEIDAAMGCNFIDRDKEKLVDAVSEKMGFK